VKQGWQLKKVGEVAQHSLGKMLDKAKNKGEPQPYLRNLNVRWFGFELSDVLEMRFLPAETERYTAVKGDVLVCEGGYPGRAAIWDQDIPIFFQKALHRVRFHEPERNKWFLYYLFFCDLQGTLRENFNGAGIQHFTGEALAQFELPLPPLPEQRRVVATLDEAFDGIATAKANAEKNLQNARALFESYLQKVFSERGVGWIRTTLGKATGGVFTGPFGSLLHKSDYVVDGIPLVNPAHITNNGIEPDSHKTVSEETAQRLSSYIMRAGDIVIGRRGEMGRCALVTDQEDGWLCGTGSFFIKASERYVPGYLVRLLRTDAYKQKLEKMAGGAVMPNLSNTDLGNLPIDMPPLERQKSILSEIEVIATEVKQLEALYQQKLTALDDLKKSLLHQAFTGKLTAKA
jgi:type I restriction enzyme, S subunit